MTENTMSLLHLYRLFVCAILYISSHTSVTLHEGSSLLIDHLVELVQGVTHGTRSLQEVLLTLERRRTALAIKLVADEISK